MINPPAPAVLNEIETITSKKQSEYSSKELTDLANRGMVYVRARITITQRNAMKVGLLLQVEWG